MQLRAQDIVSMTEFKAHPSRIVDRLRRNRRPVVLTVNGKSAAVLLSPAAFDALPAGTDALHASDDPVLAELWDNAEDAVWDTFGLGAADDPK